MRKKKKIPDELNWEKLIEKLIEKIYADFEKYIELKKYIGFWQNI